MTLTAHNDAELVSATLNGDRDAFGQIVSRYQSLLCSLAYSATGSLGQSEDLAQETFITAWKRLGHLRERDKLRAWLCGIARNRINNFLRREGREPIRKAEPLEEISESHSPEPLPADYVISKEESEILWRSLELIPHIYREPLILFYREQQSIETVAANLDLTEDAVKQRLSRGRKLLQEQVLAFVEGALARTNPGKVFTLGVLAALPAVVATSAKAATIGAAAAKGGATAKAAGAMGLLGAIFSPLLIFFGNYIPYRMALDEAQSDEERNYIKIFYRKKCTWAFIGSLIGLVTALCYGFTHGKQFGYGEFLDLFMVWFISFIVIYLLGMFPFAIAMSSKRRAYFSKILAEKYNGVFPKAVFEYRSKLELLGLPLVHIRISDRFEMLRKPATGWIAMGDRAIGGLFAFGGVAIAPFSIGGLAIGLLPFGGITFGVVALGALSVGIWTFGVAAIGWQSLGAFAFAWDAAAGNLAMAHTFAVGNVARAIQANNDIAKQFIDANLFFRWMRAVSNHWFWLNVLWVTPLFIQWRIVAHKKRKN
jgi:RNA polymerase sigma factor (sigma-70 family)